jgi:hypothetical protein
MPGSIGVGVEIDDPVVVAAVAEFSDDGVLRAQEDG